MLTAAFVRECKPRAKMYEVTCDGLPGFVIRVLPSGRKIALVRSRVDGKDHRARIGQLGPALSLDEARRRAAILLAGGQLEASEREQARRRTEVVSAPVKPPRTVQTTDVTLRELAQRYIRVHVDVHLKPGTAENYKSLLRSRILPALGDRDFRRVTKADVEELHASMRDRPGSANYMLCVVGSLYKKIIEDWQLAEMRNPAHKIRNFPLRRRERFLTPEERRRIHDVIQMGLKVSPGRKGHLKLPSVWALDLLALTGRRRDEILTLKWEMIDWQHSILNLPDTKTGELRTPVSARVLALLRHIHEQTGAPRSGFVLRSERGTRLRGINRTWENIREAADLKDVRLHDLRHSFASDALMSGVPLAVVGEMLGHKELRTTKRYAHLANHVVRQALEVTTERIVEAVNPAPALAHVASFAPMLDEQWRRIAAIVEGTRDPCGGRRTDLRRTVDGIRWVLHHSAKWREVPVQYGASTTCWRWYERWCSDGTWLEIVGRLKLPSDQVERAPSSRASRSRGRNDVPPLGAE